jgi:hypothetical protein
MVWLLVFDVPKFKHVFLSGKGHLLFFLQQSRTSAVCGMLFLIKKSFVSVCSVFLGQEQKKLEKLPFQSKTGAIDEIISCFHGIKNGC